MFGSYIKLEVLELRVASGLHSKSSARFSQAHSIFLVVRETDAETGLVVREAVTGPVSKSHQAHQPLSSIELSDSSHRQREGKLSTQECNCLQSFWPSGIDYESQKNQNPTRVSNTCLWTLHNPKYLEWRDNNTKRLLWISADPECRKCVLTRYIVDEDLFSVLQNYLLKQVLYYFFKNTSIKQ